MDLNEGGALLKNLKSRQAICTNAKGIEITATPTASLFPATSLSKADVWYSQRLLICVYRNKRFRQSMETD